MKIRFPIRRSVSVLALGIATAVAAGWVSVANAHPPNANHWLWQTGHCKGYLAKYGIELSDGRTFRALSSKDVFCGGLPYCLYDRSDRGFWYDHFSVAMINGNGIYRTMKMHITGEENYRVDDIRMYGRAKTVAEAGRFRKEAKQAMAAVSRSTQPNCEIQR